MDVEGGDAHDPGTVADRGVLRVGGDAPHVVRRDLNVAKLRDALVAVTTLMAAASVAISAGCGGATSEGASGLADNEQLVRAADYGEDWPLTVNSGVLRCDEPGAVTFTSGGTTYWINGTAGNFADENGWLDVEPIWRDDPEDPDPAFRVDISPLLDGGLALCEPVP